MVDGGTKRKPGYSPELDFEQDFESRLKRARDQLSILREQEDLLERERKELEGLQTETAELEADKREINAELSAALAALVEEEEETTRRQEESMSARKEFEALIKEMQFVERRGKKVEDIPRKIVLEREIVDRAREAFDRTRKKLNVIEEGGIAREEEELEYTHPVFGLAQGFKIGIGFFLAGALVSSIFYILHFILRQ